MTLKTTVIFCLKHVRMETVGRATKQLLTRRPTSGHPRSPRPPLPHVAPVLRQCFTFPMPPYPPAQVNLVSEHIWCEDFLVRSFYLKNLQTNETRTVTQFHFLSWYDQGVPSSARSLLDFRRYDKQHAWQGHAFMRVWASGRRECGLSPDLPCLRGHLLEDNALCLKFTCCDYTADP